MLKLFYDTCLFFLNSILTRVILFVHSLLFAFINFRTLISDFFRIIIQWVIGEIMVQMRVLQKGEEK